MMYVLHPDPACNQSQAELLASLPVSKQRTMFLILLSGNITYRYHQDAMEFSPIEQDWKEWLDGLDSTLREGMEKEGFEQGKHILSFKRYMMEKNDVGLGSYLKSMMNFHDYADYQAIVNMPSSHS